MEVVGGWWCDFGWFCNLVRAPVLPPSSHLDYMLMTFCLYFLLLFFFKKQKNNRCVRCAVYYTPPKGWALFSDGCENAHNKVARTHTQRTADCCKLCSLMVAWPPLFLSTHNLIIRTTTKWEGYLIFFFLFWYKIAQSTVSFSRANWLETNKIKKKKKKGNE